MEKVVISHEKIQLITSILSDLSIEESVLIYDYLVCDLELDLDLELPLPDKIKDMIKNRIEIK